jgi:hypothetical protein
MLYVVLVLLMIDSLLEVAFIGSTVGYLHKDGIFNVVGPNNNTVQLFLKPVHLLVDQGHTSNGAAGTALILVGLLGLLVLSYQPRIERSVSNGNSIHTLQTTTQSKETNVQKSFLCFKFLGQEIKLTETLFPASSLCHPHLPLLDGPQHPLIPPHFRRSNIHFRRHRHDKRPVDRSLQRQEPDKVPFRQMGAADMVQCCVEPTVCA